MTTPKPDRVHQIICAEIQDCEKAAEIVTAIRAVIAEELEELRTDIKIKGFITITDAQKKVRGA